MFPRQCEVVIAGLVLFVNLIYCFNLEPRIPIIKKGPANSHFGYSVAQHEALIPGTPATLKNRFKPWILVGAPKGENLQPGTNHSGALFKCPLTSYKEDCEQVLTDGIKGDDGRISRPSVNEIKDDQWLGVTVKSQGQGGYILVCAHRYQRKGLKEETYRWGYGLCYRLTDNFDYEDNYQPCMGKPVQYGHHQFGYCQAGTSGVIMDDEVVLGVPGTYTWRGTVFSTNISSDYLRRDKTQYLGVYTEELSPVDKYSYLGYSVAVGKFFGDRISYVAGAPRSRDNGQVIFFSKEKIGSTMMPYDLVLNGEKLASSFGFEVLVMDINGDSLDDLVVSAPFYFTQHVSGAVYIYLNDGDGISYKTPFTRLEGEPGETRFGYSMTSLGDLNLDGYNDLAIGAPYEGKGAIYIYLGSKDGVIKKPSQIIRAEQLPGLSYDAFGYALSGGMDLDNNGYNDLLTSSFCSDRVILLRARPIIGIQTKVEPLRALQDIDPARPGCPEHRDASETCFSFQACFKMMKEAGSLTFLQLRYKISERMYGDQTIARIRFNNGDPDVPSTGEQTLQLRPENPGSYQCSQEIVYLKNDNRDVLRPVRFKLSYEVVQQEPKPVEEGRELPDIDLYPILNQQEAVRYFEASFAKDCETNVCQSDLILESEIDLPLKPGTNDIHLLELGRRHSFALVVNVANEGEPAYQTNLYVSHDEAIDLSLKESETSSYQCLSIRSDLVHCQLDNPLLNTTGPLKLVFKPSGFPFRFKMMDLDLWVNSTSNELRPEDNKMFYDLDVKRRAEISISASADPEQVFYSGDVVGESAVTTLDEIGTPVTHKYLVDNRGPWKVDELQVEIQWPYQVENNQKEGKWLLYMTGIPFVDGDGECDIDPMHINPLLLQREYISVPDEVDTNRLFGGRPPTDGTTTRKNTTYTVTSTSTKKVSSSSSSSSSTDTNQYEDSYGRGGTRTHSRVSRKTYGGSDRGNKYPITDKDQDEYDYQTYDNLFNKKDGSYYDPDTNAVGGGSKTTKETTYTKKVYTDSRYGSTKFDTSYDRMSAIDDIQTVKENGRTFINGYDKEGRLIWSSKDRYNEYGSPVIDGDGTDRARTEITRKTHTSAGTGSGDSRRNATHYSTAYAGESAIKQAVQFRIQRRGKEAWLNGYDRKGNLVWTSIAATTGSGDPPGKDSSYYSEYSYKKTYSPSEGEKVKEEWSSSSGDKGSKSWSSKPLDGERSSNYKNSRISSTSFQDNEVKNSEVPRFDWDEVENPEHMGRWSQSGGYRRNQHQSQDGENVYHGTTYSRVVNDDSGDAKVYTQRVFVRRQGDQWEEVKRGPFEDSEWDYERASRQVLKRTKREREMVIKPEAITDAQSGKIMQVVNFRCDGEVPTAKCFTFTCTIRNLAADQASSIRIPSRLWNSTLIEDYPRVSYVSIRSKATLILPEEIQSDQDTSDDEASAETLAYSNLLEQLPPEEVPLWVILVSVLAGLLLLVLIAVVLWKLGFFKRRRPDPTLSGNLKGR